RWISGVESSRPDAGYYCGLTAGQSVLVTSHTNVAVDNVLKELVTDDQKYGLGIMTPGTVIRQSGDDRKVLSNVRDHDFLLSDKAAAVKTNLDERLKALEEELEHNMAHPVRERESDLFDQLVGTGFDIKRCGKSAKRSRLDGNLKTWKPNSVTKRGSEKNSGTRYRKRHWNLTSLPILITRL